MNATATMTSSRTQQDKAVTDLLASIESAVRGASHAGTLSPRVLPAFSVDAAWQPVSLGDGLWAILRTSADGSAKALCVHNLTDTAVSFASPASLTTTGAGSRLHFVRGSARTSENGDGGIDIHLEGRSFVWLAGFDPGAASSS